MFNRFSKSKVGYYFVIIIFGIIEAELIIIMINEAYKFSEHPIESLLLRIIVFILIIIPIILRKLYIFVYYLFIFFPFMESKISGISLVAIFSLIFFALYNKEIIANFYKNNKYYNIPIIIISICFIFTTIRSFNPFDAIKTGLLHYGALIIAYNILLNYIKTQRDFRNILYLITGIFIICNIVSIWQYLFGIESIKLFIGEYNPNTNIFGFSKRIPSVFVEAQAAGQYFATNIIIMNGIMIEIKKKISFCFIFIIGIISLLLTISRMAILSFLIFYIITIIYILFYKKRINYLILLVILILIAPLLYEKTVPDQFKDRFNSEAQKESYNFRVNMWKASLIIIEKYPFGVGLGGENLYNAAILEGAIDNTLINKINEKDITYFHFENSFLSVLYSIGIVGFIGFLILLYKYFKKAAKYIINGNKKQKYFAVYLSASMFVWLSCAYTSPLIQQVQPLFLFTILFVLIDKMNLLSA